MNRTTFLVTLLLPLLIFSQDAIYDDFSSKLNTNNTKTYTVLDAGINTEFHDEGGTFFMNKFLIISSRKIGAFSRKDGVTKQPYSKVYCMDIKQSGDLKRPLLFSSSLNAKKAHIGAIVFTPDEKTAYFTKSNSKNNYQLYKATINPKKLGKWESIELLDFYLNKPYLDIKDLYVNPEGTLLYFCSNSAKGYGGYDIYASDIKKDRSLGTPLNLGKNINSKGDERSPYIAPNKKHLFFASSGHQSYGGLDLFKSRIVHHQFTQPINLGKDINSQLDDYGYVIANNRIGYFTSNRLGGHGNTDIYKIVINPPIQNIAGYVLEQSNNIVLPNTKITLRDQEGVNIGKTVSDKNGFYEFKKIISKERYTLHVEKEGFFTLNTTFNAYHRDNYTYKENIFLHTESPEIITVDDKMMINLENIFFEFNKANLKKESIPSLNKVIDILNKYTQYNLSIIAHTDNRGYAKYNQLLSEKRAQVALSYIAKHGISKQRLKAIGMGEDKLLIDCKDNCSEKDHFSNRRTEFILTNK